MQKIYAFVNIVYLDQIISAFIFEEHEIKENHSSQQQRALSLFGTSREVQHKIISIREGRFATPFRFFVELPNSLTAIINYFELSHLAHIARHVPTAEAWLAAISDNCEFFVILGI